MIANTGRNDGWGWEPVSDVAKGDQTHRRTRTRRRANFYASGIIYAPCVLVPAVCSLFCYATIHENGDDNVYADEDDVDYNRWTDNMRSD